MLADPPDDTPRSHEQPQHRETTLRAISHEDCILALTWLTDITTAARHLAAPTLTTPPAHFPLAAAAIKRRVDDIAALLGITLNDASTTG